MKSTLLDPPPLRHPSHTGNFYGKGDVRRGEMVAAAGLLGIQAERVEVLDQPELQVGGKTWMHVCVYILDGGAVIQQSARCCPDSWCLGSLSGPSVD